MVFLNGEEEIEYAVSKIELEIGLFEDQVDPVVVLPLYGKLNQK